MNWRLAWSVVVLIAAIWILKDGARYFFVVQSGSMKPVLKIGDLIFVRPEASYTNGDIITFKNSDGRVTTHRISKVLDNGFLTKGDANMTGDSAVVNNHQVVGKVVQIFSSVGMVANAAKTKVGFVFLFLLPLVAILAADSRIMTAASLIPLMGILFLRVEYTSADLNAEVAVKANSMKATTVEISLQDTVNNLPKSYLFNLSGFQKGSLSATTIRIRNIGKEKTKYKLSTKLEGDNQTCKQLSLKILDDDEVVYNEKLVNLELKLEEMESGKKNDLIFLIKDDENNNNEPTICNYILEVATEMDSGFSDIKKANSQIEITK